MVYSQPCHCDCRQTSSSWHLKLSLHLILYICPSCQVLMERFNADSRIFCFILSTRSGGLGVNLTGADTVIFYDSDWNPTMDAQAQDRCHRIGQTRDVHIYRLISERTVEENILKKANQKRMLGNIAIEGGNFTTAYFKEVRWNAFGENLLTTNSHFKLCILISARMC